MARKDPKQAKYEQELQKTIQAIDKAQGRIIRWANKLADLRVKRTRLVRNLAKMATEANPVPTSKPQSKGPKNARFSNLDM